MDETDPMGRRARQARKATVFKVFRVRRALRALRVMTARMEERDRLEVKAQRVRRAIQGLMAPPDLSDLLDPPEPMAWESPAPPEPTEVKDHKARSDQ